MPGEALTAPLKVPLTLNLSLLAPIISHTNLPTYLPLNHSRNDVKLTSERTVMSLVSLTGTLILFSL